MEAGVGVLPQEMMLSALPGRLAESVLSHVPVATDITFKVIPLGDATLGITAVNTKIKKRKVTHRWLSTPKWGWPPVRLTGVHYRFSSLNG